MAKCFRDPDFLSVHCVISLRRRYLLRKAKKREIPWQPQDRHICKESGDIVTLIEKYYHHCAKAKHDPKSYLTIIVDGMDQQKTLLPHYVSQSKVSFYWLSTIKDVCGFV